MLRRLRRRRLSRRLLICLVGLCLIALTAAGLVWLLEGFRTYNPVYYEPKDVERERFETQRRSLDTKPGLQRP
jgi:cytochrome c-type biogenesis protein CcmE